MDINLADLIPITAIAASAWVAVTLIRLWYRPSATETPGNGASVAHAEENARLAHENESLRLTVRRLEERMSVLERIATDPAERTAREIEELR